MRETKVPELPSPKQFLSFPGLPLKPFSIEVWISKFSNVTAVLDARRLFERATMFAKIPHTLFEQQTKANAQKPLRNA